MNAQLSLAYGFFPRRSFSIEAAKGDHIAKIIERTGTFYELAVLERHLALFGKPRVVLDIGANIGNHSLFWGGVLGARVLAFEPHPTIHRILLRNVEANGLAHVVTPIPLACGKAGTSISMEIPDPANLGTSRVARSAPGATGATSAQQTRLDDINLQLHSIDRIDLVKIDTEGHECDVLEGALSTLERFRPNLWIETSGPNHERCERLLEGLGYRQIGAPAGHSDNYFMSIRPVCKSAPLRVCAYDTTRKLRWMLRTHRLAP